jgi:phage shock protein A
LKNLIEGIFATWVRGREVESPEAVYEQAIREKARQYRELKQAVAGILYMRHRIERESRDRRTEIVRLQADIARAVRRGEDDVALALIPQKESLVEDLERSQEELKRVREEVEAAKSNLLQFRGAIRALQREKARALATLANAQARARIQEALEGLSVDSEMQALETVREHIARMVTESRLGGELEDAGLQSRIRSIREEAREEAARRELEELKRRLRPAIPAGPVNGETVESASV